jgi:hypothetical protein
MFHKLEFASRSRAEMQPQAVGHLDTFSTEDLIMLELHEASLQRSRLVKDSAPGNNLASRINWAAIVGLGLAAVISVSVWTGVALAITHVWK